MSEANGEPTPLTDQDKIRLKRIERLQQQQQQAQKQESPIASTSSAPPPKPIPSPALRKPIVVHRAPASSASVLTASYNFTDTFETWQDGALSRVLKVTLNAQVAESTQWETTLLKETAEELLSEDPSLAAPLHLRLDWADRLLLARLCLGPDTESEDPEQLTAVAALPSDETSFDYLGGCWKRERQERYKLVEKKTDSQHELQRRLDVLNQVKALVVSYIGLVLADPSMFPQEHLSGKTIGPLELRPLLIPSSVSAPPYRLQPSDLPQLLQDLALRFTPSESNDHEGGFTDILAPLINSSGRDLLAHKLDIGNVNPGFRDHLGALQGLSEAKSIASVLVTLPNWDVVGQPLVSAPQVEMLSLLGPFLRLSAFPDAFPQIASTFFPDPSAMTHGDIESAQMSLRGTLSGVQNSFFQIFDKIVRSSPESRAGVLSYLGHVATANNKRAAMRVDPRTVSSHGFIINLHTVLLSFAAPFMDATYSKIDKIDPLYYKKSERLDIAEDTKMSATKTESEEYYSRDASIPPTPAPNFISEIFFLACAYLHIGVMHTIKEHKGIAEQVRHMQRQLDDMEADTSWRGTPNEAQTLGSIERFKKKQQSYVADQLAYEVQLLDPAYLARCVAFGNLLMVWLVRLVDPAMRHPQTLIRLPLPEETPEAFRFLPEYLIEDLTDFFAFTSKYAPHVLTEAPLDELMTFMLVFLSSPYVKNPYLKGQFVEIMFYLTRPMHRYPRGALGDVLNFHPLALKNLMPCLVHAYVQIEITGSHTQFYDKFNTRYYITQLFKLVWSNPTHRDALKLASLDIDNYVRFANLLMNDTTFLLGDAIDHLGKLVDIQKKMDDTAAWEALPATERQEKEKLLRQYEGQVRSDLDLGHESLRLIKLFAAETREPFLTPEIVDRLAAMLDMNLNMLAGPRCQDLKVKDPEKLKFRPKDLLSDVLQIFIELGTRLEFQTAVAKDERSYSHELFERATRIARKTAIKTEDELALLAQMVAKVEEIKAAAEEDDASGDVPDEFLDPLTYDIMRDPVILPSSKTVIDRSSIRQHYLSDASDPFNRVPFKWEDLSDAVELKAQIDGFLAERRQKRLAVQSALLAQTTTEEEGEAMAVD